MSVGTDPTRRRSSRSLLTPGLASLAIHAAVSVALASVAAEESAVAHGPSVVEVDFATTDAALAPPAATPPISPPARASSRRAEPSRAVRSHRADATARRTRADDAAETPAWDRFHVYEGSLAAPTDAVPTLPETRLLREDHAPRLAIDRTVPELAAESPALEPQPAPTEEASPTAEGESRPPVFLSLAFGEDAEGRRALPRVPASVADLDARLRELAPDDSWVRVVVEAFEPEHPLVVGVRAEGAGAQEPSPVELEGDRVRASVGARFVVVCPRAELPRLSELLAALDRDADAADAIARAYARADAPSLAPLVVAVACRQSEACVVETRSPVSAEGTTSLTLEAALARDARLAAVFAEPGTEPPDIALRE